MTIEELLEKRHTEILAWSEPHPACGPEGNDLDAHVELQATVHDCVNMQRLKARAAGGGTMGNDADFLSDFIVTHWAFETVNSQAVEESHSRELASLLASNSVIPYVALEDPEGYDDYATVNGISYVAKEFESYLNKRKCSQ